jgi:predicted ATP-dependent endonuclease of OLD family
MNLKQELRIVKIKEDLGEGTYLSEDVFNKEELRIILSGKLRMNYYSIPVDKVVYACIVDSDTKNARYIYTWRDAMSLDNTETRLDKQRKILDAKFIELYGKKEYLQLPN